MLWSCISFAMESDESQVNHQCCTFSKTGNKYRSSDFHGTGDKYYMCFSCSWNPWQSICPNCAKACHKSHCLYEVLNAGPYYCYCGANEAGYFFPAPCQVMPNGNNKEISQTARMLSRQQYFSMFSKIATPHKSFAFAPILLEHSLLALSCLKNQQKLLVDNTEYLQLKTYCFGYDYNLATSVGIKTSFSLSSLAKIIKKETDFTFDFKDAARVLVATAKSEERFFKSFWPELTKEKIVHDALGQEKQWPTMVDYSPPFHRYFEDDKFIAIEIPYKSHRKLILLMAQASYKDTILHAAPEEWEDTMNKLLSSQTRYSQHPLFIPKFSIRVNPVSILNRIGNFLSDSALKLLRDIDDIQMGTTFDLHENGTNASGAIAAIAKGGGAPLNFNRPYLALVVDEKHWPLFIAYNNFDG